MTLEELQIILKVNNKQLISGLKDSVNHINKMQNSVSGSMTRIKSSFKSLATFVVGLGIGRILKDSITAGMDSIEADNRFQVLFQGYANEMRQWSNELEKSLGINGYAARSAASNFYELATAQGVSKDVAKDMAKNLTMTAYDIASFKDKDPSQVLNAMQSALVGNTQALRSMGYVVTAEMVKQEAYQQGIAATGSQLTQTQKAMATYSLMMKQAGAAHGDLARTINSPSNQLRILKEQLVNLKTELGRAFLPIVQIILPLLNSFVTKLIQVVKVFGQFMQALFGKPIGGTGGSGDAIQDAVGNVGDLTGGLGEAEQAAKKAKNALMGFDELNTLSPKSEDTALDTGVGGGSIDVPSIDYGDTGVIEEIPARIQEMADKIKAILGNLKDFLEEHKELILAVIGGIIAGFAAFKTLTFLSNIPAMLTAISGALTALTSPITVVAAAIGALVAVFLYLYQTNEDFRNKMNTLWGELGQLFVDFKNNVLAPFGKFFMDEFLKPIGNGFKEYLLPVFAEVFVGIQEILNKITGLILNVFGDIAELLKPVLKLISDIIVDCMRIVKEKWDEYGQEFIDSIKKYIDNISKIWDNLYETVLKPVVEKAVATLKKLWDEHLKDMVSSFMDFVAKLVNGALRIYNEVIAPIINWLIEKFGPVFEKVISRTIEKCGQIIGIVADVAKTVFDALGGVIDFIVGVFTGDWELAWEGIKKIFSSIWDGIKKIFTGFSEFLSDEWEFIKSFVTELVESIKSAVCDAWQALCDRVTSLCEWLSENIDKIWTEIKEFFSGILTSIKEFVEKAWQRIKDVTERIFGGVKDFVTNIWNSIKDAIVRSIDNVKEKVTNVWNTIKTFITNTLNSIKNIVSNAWNGVQSTTSNILNNIRNTVTNAWNGITNTISNVVNTIKNTVTNAFNNVKSTMSNLASWISGTFKNLWSNAWNGVVNIFNNIWSGLTRAVKTPLNFIIDCVNTVIRGLNRIKLPDWAGGFGINIREIPRLAQGGIIDKPTIAQVGEAGPEMVVPLKNTPFVTTLANAVANATAASLSHLFDDGTQQETATPIVITMDGMEMARATVNNINRLSKVTGQNMLRV